MFPVLIARRWVGRQSLCLFIFNFLSLEVFVVPSKTIIGVPGKVVYLHYTCPKSDLSSLYYCLQYCVASLSCSLPFVSVETAGWLPCGGRASHSALRVCCRKKGFVVFYVFSFPPGVYVGTLNLIESIPGPFILTFYDGPGVKLYILVGWDWSFLSVACPTGVQLVFYFCFGFSTL